MQKIPKVAIITRTRNRNELLRRAINSVVGQSMPDWQHVIVNDGGDKESLNKLCGEFKKNYDGRLSVLHTDWSGMQNAANLAISKSNSKYIVIHDDDDSWHPDFLKQTTGFLDKLDKDSPYGGVIGKTERIIEKESPKGGFVELDRKPYVPLDNICIDRLGYENPFPPIAFLYKREIHKEIGLFDPQWDLVADLDFNFRFLQKYNIGVVDKVLAYYHWRKGETGSVNLNTVTKDRKRHASLLCELKNHYLRKANDTKGTTSAITFLLSSFAVENQWMTSEIRERTIASQDKIATLLSEIESIKKFNNEAAWPKLEYFAGEYKVLQKGLNEIAESLKNFEQKKFFQLSEELNNQLRELKKFNHETTWPKLENFAAKHDALQNEISQFADLLKNLQQEKILSLVEESGNQLEAINKFNNEATWPKLEYLAKTNEDIQKQLGGITKSLERLEKLFIESNSQAAILSKLETVESSLETVMQRLATTNSDLKEIKKERKTEWKLGPFKLTRVNPEDSDEQQISSE